jgi:RND superfamily putative drug exporter
MTSLLSTAGIARLSARHPWRVVAVWGVVLLLAMVAASDIQDIVTGRWEFTNKPESVRGFDLMKERLGIARPVTETVIVQTEAGSVDAPAVRAIVEQTTADLRALTGIVAGATNYYEARAAGAPEAETLVAADRRTTLIPVSLADYETASDHFGRVLQTLERHETTGVRVLTVGTVSIDETFNTIAEQDLLKGELFGIPIALVILILAIRALVAPALPLALAIASILIATGLAALIGRVFTLSFYVTNMISLIGLAVGIDYAFFIVERYREERRRGRGKLDAIEVAGGTASKAVLVSGVTVVLALIGLFMLSTTIFSSLAMGAILVVIIAVLAMLTLVPALLGLLGDRIDWPRRDGQTDRRTGGQPPVPSLPRSSLGFTARFTRIVMGRPVLSVVLAVGVLIAAALPVIDIKTGMAGVDTLPESDVKTAMAILGRDFAAGLATPVEIVVDGSRTPEIEATVARLSDAIAADPAFASAPTVTWSSAGDPAASSGPALALLTVPLAVDPSSDAAYAAIGRLRHELIPSLVAGVPVRVYVTGETAYRQDFFDLADTAAPKVFAFVLGLSFLLLLLVFRSLIVPLKAIVMNLLSVGAAYGLLVLVFQKGYLHGVFGFQKTPTIEAWIPIFLFCVLFGLSMDYHVFLLSRIREHFDATGRNTESVATGLHATAKIITGAALIMVAVFAGFAAGRLVMFQQMGFGLAVAVLLDATVVRSVLVPATMALLGNRNWFLPSWLTWLPRLSIEGSATGEPAEPIAGVAAD